MFRLRRTRGRADIPRPRRILARTPDRPDTVADVAATVEVAPARFGAGYVVVRGRGNARPPSFDSRSALRLGAYSSSGGGSPGGT
jgi:hypothetical protein